MLDDRANWRMKTRRAAVVLTTAAALFASLDDKQKALFIEEMVRLSRERGLD